MKGGVRTTHDPNCPGCGQIANHDSGEIYRCTNGECQVITFDGEMP
jgi:ribosomal protein S27AE